MHRIAATPGGWNPQAEGVIFLNQTPAPLIFLTAADTDIQTVARAIDQLPPNFPALRVANLLNLQQPLTIDTYAEEVLEHAQVILLRLLGGRTYWSYGLEVVQDVVQRTGAALIVLPGDDRPDPDLLSLSTLPLAAVNQIWRYFIAGGVENGANALKFIANHCLKTAYECSLPQDVPEIGRYRWRRSSQNQILPTSAPRVGLLFYRAHYLAGNTTPIDALCHALTERGLEPIPVFTPSLRDPNLQAEVLQLFLPKDEPAVEVVLNTTSFAIAELSGNRRQAAGGGRQEFSIACCSLPVASLWHQLNVPVLQVILSGGTVEQWQSQLRGLLPRDMAMNVALPEVDGRIISRAVSFKAVQTRHAVLETDVVTYEPMGDRIQFVADLTVNWVKLRRTPAHQRKIALILANYPTRDGRLANGVGLDTPASCIEIIKALLQAGYSIENPPQTADELMHRLTTGITNDPEGRQLRLISQNLSQQEYQQYFATLPETVQQGIGDRWGGTGNSPHSPTSSSAFNRLAAMTKILP